MPIKLPADGLRHLCSQFAAAYPRDIVEFREVRRRRAVPVDLTFGPDVCIRTATGFLLVHVLSAPALPAWVARAARRLRHAAKAAVLVVAPDSLDESGAKVASTVAQDCLRSSAGLAFESGGLVHLVFPPRYRIPRRCASSLEYGHIPTWVLDALAGSSGFSDHVRQALKTFTSDYRALTRRSAPSYNRECGLLLAFAEQLAAGDPRLFFPHGRLELLREFERGGANQSARDHFFHTFNNLLLGFVVLSRAFPPRRNNVSPDRFLADPKGVAPAKFWESLWALTCLFHDPGYLAENPWCAHALSLGVFASGKDAPPVPDAMEDRLLGAWDADYLASRKDLRKLFSRTCDPWSPGVTGRKAETQFDLAVRKAYYDGERASHSVISGLSLIQRCRNDQAVPEKGYDKQVALTACEIAGLSMLFHDMHAREIMVEAGVPQIPFEQMPYASTLMFVDALQDDRRDIRTSEFRKHGILSSLDVIPQEQAVHAEVCLREVPLAGWPFRIAEYDSVTRWINTASDMKFHIDYLSRLGLRAYAPRNNGRH